MIAVHVLFSSEAADAHTRINTRTLAHTQSEKDNPYRAGESAARIILRFSCLRLRLSACLSHSLPVSLSVLPTVRVSAFARQTAQPLPFHVDMNACLKSTVNHVLIRVQKANDCTGDYSCNSRETCSLPGGHCALCLSIKQWWEWWWRRLFSSPVQLWLLLTTNMTHRKIFHSHHTPYDTYWQNLSWTHYSMNH